jgi:ATP-dependent DNA ligase
MPITPDFLYPMKPVRANWNIFRTLDPSKYTMEAKYDGFRCLVQADDSISLWTRDKVRMAVPDNLAEQLQSLHLLPGTLLDGEIWNMG